MIAFERGPDEYCRRNASRKVVARASTVRADGVLARDVIVDDLSCDGFSFGSVIPFTLDTRVSVGLAGAGCAEARVIWRDRTRHGCVFEPPLNPTQVAAAFTHAGTAVLIEPLNATALTSGLLPYRRAALILALATSGWLVFAAAARLL